MSSTASNPTGLIDVNALNFGALSRIELISICKHIADERDNLNKCRAEMVDTILYQRDKFINLSLDQKDEIRELRKENQELREKLAALSLAAEQE